MILPLFINKENRLRMALMCGVVFLLGYSIPNHFHLFTPQYLPLTSWDLAIPFVPWTIYAYISEYLLFVTAYFHFSRELNRNRYVWAYFGVLMIGAFFFVFYPTTYPRANYPLPAGLDPVTYYVFYLIRALDNPSNCFPSMHVTCCYLTAFAFLPKEEKRYKFWLYFVWSTVVALSTLPTKQHYIADVISGLVLSVIGYIIFFKMVKYVSLSEFVSRFRGFAKTRVS